MKKYLVVGMARSGVSAALLLAKKGFSVRVNDDKTRDQLGEALDCLNGYDNVEWRLGEPAVQAMDGMDELIISPGISVESALVQEAQQRGLVVTGELELGYQMTRGDLLAITGTNGKTTTTTLLGEIMRNAGKTTHVVGNIGIPYTSVSFDSKDEDVTVCEVSSFQMETAREFHPVISAILNLTPDHLNRHHTMENYLAMKKRVFAREQGESEYLVLNYDDPALRPVADEARCRVVWFSRTQTPPYGAFLRDGAMVFGTPNEYRNICEAAEIYIPGPHNLENAMAASAMALLYGVPAPVIRHTLRTFRGVEHRIEFVREVGGVRLINDSKGTNADSTIKAVQTMNRPTVLILGGSDKHVDFTELCTVIRDSGMIRRIVLIGDTAAQLAETLDKVGYAAYEHCGYDFRAAVSRAYELAQEGENVLLSPACASFDMFTDYEARGRIFKELVRELPEKA